jgi:hypothetical protein
VPPAVLGLGLRKQAKPGKRSKKKGVQARTKEASPEAREGLEAVRAMLYAAVDEMVDNTDMAAHIAHVVGRTNRYYRRIYKDTLDIYGSGPADWQPWEKDKPPGGDAKSTGEQWQRDL